MIKRGTIYWVDFNPVQGSEIGKIRPAIVVSNNINNQYNSTVTVVPISSTTSKIYPTEVFLSKGEANLQNDSKAKADQIRTIDKRRLGNEIGKLPNSKIEELEVAILIHLNISI